MTAWRPLSTSVVGTPSWPHSALLIVCLVLPRCLFDSIFMSNHIFFSNFCKSVRLQKSGINSIFLTAQIFGSFCHWSLPLATDSSFKKKEKKISVNGTSIYALVKSSSSLSLMNFLWINTSWQVVGRSCYLFGDRACWQVFWMCTWLCTIKKNETRVIYACGGF